MLPNHVCPIVFFFLPLFLFFFSFHPYYTPLPPTLLFVTASSPLPGWNELLIASFSHRSVGVKDGLMLANDLHVSRETAHTVGVETIFDRYTFTQAHAHTCASVNSSCLAMPHSHQGELSRFSTIVLYCTIKCRSRGR